MFSALDAYRTGFEKLHRDLRSTPVPSKAAALRSAALGLMKRPEYRHPYIGPAFICWGTGNRRARREPIRI